MNPVRVGIQGADGKMGREVLSLIKTQPWAQVWADLQTADAIIDFSSPVGCLQAAKLASKLKIPIVSGTTGLSAVQFKTLKALAKKTPVLWSANMSWGIFGLRKMLKSFQSFKDYDFRIEERHHKHKKDRPSGTAKVLRADLERILARKIARPLSVRAGSTVGIHKIVAASDNEMVILEHQAFSRSAFAEGALRATHWLLDRKPGFYSLEDVYDDVSR